MPPHAESNNSGLSAFDYRSLLPLRQNSSKNDSGQQQTDSAIDMGNSNNNNDNYQPSQESWFDTDGCMELTFRERMLGFGTCMIAGYMLSFGSFWRIRDLVFGNPLPLVLHTIIGNLLSFAGSFFLVGPKTQWKRMWEDKRKRSTQVYLASLVLMLVIILIHPPGPEGLYLFLLIVVQNAAIAWYCISYIPFAQETIKSWATRFVSPSGDMDVSYMPAPV